MKKNLLLAALFAGVLAACAKNEPPNGDAAKTAGDASPAMSEPTPAAPAAPATDPNAAPAPGAAPAAPAADPNAAPATK